jgi:hypothetical protein
MSTEKQLNAVLFARLHVSLEDKVDLLPVYAFLT